ncbi:RING-H2 finger protein ATL7-like [Olea europaea var. sylvestris]|uniref:RING-H2 finger protein ATL7-like n=1 Tax=Olea europaea var. sylvestris TaxID=158386 RepID=UPI000C1D4ADC|nr:RING-H2 finger protein ATL7-like [Olea europaea var. sylvestris]
MDPTSIASLANFIKNIYGKLDILFENSSINKIPAFYFPSKNFMQQHSIIYQETIFSLYTMFQMRLQPNTVLSKYIILIACLLNWAWDYLLPQSSSFQPREIVELPDYVDDLTVTRYENNNNAKCEDSSTECIVCLCRIGEGDEVKELGCNHLYHRVCLDRWVRHGHRTCPLCRENLKPPVPQLSKLICIFNIIQHSICKNASNQLKPQFEGIKKQKEVIWSVK